MQRAAEVGSQVTARDDRRWWRSTEFHWGHCIFTFKTSLTEPDQPSKVSQSLGTGFCEARHVDHLSESSINCDGLLLPQISFCYFPLIYDLFNNTHEIIYDPLIQQFPSSEFHRLIHGSWGHTSSTWLAQSEQVAPKLRVTGTDNSDNQKPLTNGING